MKKFDFWDGLSFGILMAIFGIIQALWFIDVYTTATILKAILTGIIAGVLAGFFWGLFSGWYKSSKYADKKTKKNV